jgi:hypothetical protein
MDGKNPENDKQTKNEIKLYLESCLWKKIENESIKILNFDRKQTNRVRRLII